MDILKERDKKITCGSIEAILNIQPEFSPEPVCFIQGMDLFRMEYFKDRAADIGLADLKRLGVKFWKEKLEALQDSKKKQEDEEVADISDRSPAEEAPSLGWTPERIQAALRSIIRTGIFYIRRAHWFCRLCESTIIWKANNGDHYFLLKIEAGNFPAAESFEPEEKIPIPIGYKKNRLERLECFDMGTYDRMRILTTEIRRILSERREVKICFSPHLTLRTEQIKKLLEWM